MNKKACFCEHDRYYCPAHPYSQEKPEETTIHWRELAWNEISVRVSTNYKDWPWIRASIYELVAKERTLAYNQGREEEAIGCEVHSRDAYNRGLSGMPYKIEIEALLPEQESN